MLALDGVAAYQSILNAKLYIAENSTPVCSARVELRFVVKVDKRMNLAHSSPNCCCSSVGRVRPW